MNKGLSIIVCSVNPKRLEALQLNIKATISDSTEYEIIAIDNRNPSRPLSEVYNEGGRRANYSNLLFIHEDAGFITKKWDRNILPMLVKESTGIIGFAGTILMPDAPCGWGNGPKWSLVNVKECGNVYKFNIDAKKDFTEVVAVDGFAMFVRKDIWEKHPFDEVLLRGFHGYDVDFSLSAARNYRNYVSNKVELFHNSSGNFGIEWIKTINKCYHRKWNKILPMMSRDLNLNEKELRREAEQSYYRFLRQLNKVGYRDPLIISEFNKFHSTRKHIGHLLKLRYKYRLNHKSEETGISCSLVASVIIAVYNRFDWLRLILDALRMQTFSNFEVVIADDGSDDKTIKQIIEYSNQYPELRIVHAWHDDKGWRKNTALNNAVRKSAGEYLIFIDGDCIPHKAFVEDHIRLARRGIVMGGRRIESDKPLSDMMENFKELPENYFCLARRKILCSVFNTSFGKTLSQLRRSLRFPIIAGKPLGIKNQGILGANFGIYRSDLERVNGFDERYRHPGTGEDVDLDLRLENAGISHRKASHYALMIHRCHERLNWDWEENAALLKETKDKKTTFTETGLDNTSHTSQKF